MSVVPDILPEVMPIVLLRNEDMPVAVILNELRSPQHEPRDGGNQRYENENQREPFALVRNLQAVCPVFIGQPGAVTYSWINDFLTKY